MAMAHANLTQRCDMYKDQEITVTIFPFESLTKADGQDIFCKTFYTDLLTELSRFRQFGIVGGESGQAPGDQSDYAIKGSFRFQADTLRINAQLLNNTTGQVVWAERYEGDQDSIVALEEDVLTAIVSTLQMQLNTDLLARIRKKDPLQLSAYEHWLMGMEEIKKGTVEADGYARQHFEHAIAIDPLYSLAYSGMSLTYFNEWSCQLWDRWDMSHKGAYDWAQKAIELDEQNYVAALVLGRVHLYEGEYETAEHYLRRALRLNGNDADTLIQIASCLVFLGHADEAASLFDKVIQRNPLYAELHRHVHAHIALEQGDFQRCIALGSTQKAPWVDFPNMMAAAYYAVGDLEKMYQSWQTFLSEFQKKIVHGAEVDPQQALQWVINVNPYKGRSRMEPFWKFISGSEVSFSSRVFQKVVPTVLKNSFFEEHGLWQITYEGHTIRLAAAKGFQDLATMLKHPAKEFHCTALMGSGFATTPEFVFDEKARRSYQQRIQELQEEISLSENNNDHEQRARLSREYEHLVEHLSASIGIKGRIRKSHDSIEKARSAVTWRIRNAIQKIASAHPALGKHLSSSIRTGLFCRYTPEKEVPWTFSGK